MQPRKQPCRQILGFPIINDFEFNEQLKEHALQPNDLKKYCGLTEWIVSTESAVEAVRAAFIAGQFDGDVCLQERKRDGSVQQWSVWSSWPKFIHELKSVLRPKELRVSFQTEHDPEAIMSAQFMHPPVWRCTRRQRTV